MSDDEPLGPDYKRGWADAVDVCDIRMKAQASRIEEMEAFAEAVIRYAGNAGDDYLANKARNALKGDDQ